jgi:hypothetical protein
MASYLVSYDQHRDRDYTAIWSALHGVGAVRILESVWFLISNSNAEGVRDWLRGVTRNEDSLLVVQIQPRANWAAYNAQSAGVEWLRQRVAA